MPRTLLLLATTMVLLAGVPAAAEEAASARWKDYALGATLQGHTGLVRCVAFAPDGSFLASGGSDRSLRLWEPASGKARGLLLLPPSG